MGVHIFKTDRTAAETIGELLGTLEGAIGHQDGARSMVYEMARRLLAHLAGAHDQNPLAFERAENLTRQLHRDRGDGDRGVADLGLGAHPLGDHEGALQHLVQMATDGPCGTGCQVAALHLAEDLRLTNDHGVEAAGDAEEVPHRFLLPVLVEVRAEDLRVDVEIAAKKLGQVRCIERLAGEQLHPVAGGKDHPFQHARGLGERAGGLHQFLRTDGQPLAQLDGRGFVIEAQQHDIHGAVNLCTELNWLAAQTLMTTRKAMLER